MTKDMLSIIIGSSMLVSCCIIAYIAQKIMFHSFRNKIHNTMDVRKEVEQKNDGGDSL